MTTATIDVSLDQLEAAALRLDSSSRAQLAYRLLDSVSESDVCNHPTATEQWIENAELRVQAFLDNEALAIDGEQVLHEARARVR